jgi:hypothetical protein
MKDAAVPSISARKKYEAMQELVRLHEIIALELSSNSTKKGQYNIASLQCEGDEAKTVANYVELRLDGIRMAKLCIEEMEQELYARVKLSQELEEQRHCEALQRIELIQHDGMALNTQAATEIAQFNERRANLQAAHAQRSEVVRLATTSARDKLTQTRKSGEEQRESIEQNRVTQTSSLNLEKHNIESDFSISPFQRRRMLEPILERLHSLSNQQGCDVDASQLEASLAAEAEVEASIARYEEQEELALKGISDAIARLDGDIQARIDADGRRTVDLSESVALAVKEEAILALQNADNLRQAKDEQQSVLTERTNAIKIAEGY